MDTPTIESSGVLYRAESSPDLLIDEFILYKLMQIGSSKAS
jgi:hypothetical protein